METSNRSPQKTARYEMTHKVSDLMDRVCIKHGGDEICIQNISQET